ncbi:golgin subfamily B member 1 isoform X2 [Varanus komodoensis]|uniref:golgin subfamily B member 1 isoform X2 n=1 Tax=Varanus komodoensis TaxID=61221 RepID=UPI001CF77590|nr:golgin subfamily B member 1 isoform X2 [Varanus komodoensis]
MLSRLSGLANTVLHELSGDGEDAGPAALTAEAESEAHQQNGEEAPEDLLERLAHTERLVVQLKELVREKEAQLQQKEAQLQEERQAAEAKLLKLKLQAKAKLTSLNRRIEELTEPGVASSAKELPGEPLLPAQHVQSDQIVGDKQQEEEVGALRKQLQEEKETVKKLQEQLESATSSLNEARAQHDSLREEIQAKNAQLEEQALKYQAELHRLASQSALEAEMQQNLRLLQRKLEEQEEALLGRTQVVELLQRELHTLAGEKQVLLTQVQEAEAELASLSGALASERHASRGRLEELQLALAEQKQAFLRVQEEAQQSSQELARAREALADWERRSQEAGESSQEAGEPSGVEQDLPPSREALPAESGRSTEDGSTQQGEPPARAEESCSSQAEPEVSVAQAAGQDSEARSEAVPGQGPAAAAGGPRQQEDGPPEAPAEALRAENEALRSRLAALEKRVECAAGAAELSQKSSCAEADAEPQPRLTPGVPCDFGGGSSGPGGTLDGLGSDAQEGLRLPDAPAAPAQPSTCSGCPLEPPPASENGQPGILGYLSAKRRKDLSLLLLELQEAQEELAFLKGQLPVPASADPGGGGRPQAPGTEAVGAALTQRDPSRGSPGPVGAQEEAPPSPGAFAGQDGPCAEDGEAALAAPAAASLPEQQELASLRLEVAALRASQCEAQECHRSALEERAADIGGPQQQVRDSDTSLRAPRAEWEQLLAQPEELCTQAALREQVRQLEGDLADSEKRRLSDHESGLSQLALLREQIQSLKNEAESKEVKIAALQRDLDEAQGHLVEQGLLGQSLSGQLQEEQQQREALAGQLEAASSRAEGLSRRLASAELAAAGLEQRLAEGGAERERLEQEVAEREQRMAELSRGMSDRMVQLNEEKFLLGRELSHLTEQLSRLAQGKETRELGVGTEGPAEGAVPEQQAESGEAEELRRENEQLKRKLQAALLSRKELQGKVRQLETGGQGGAERPPEAGAQALAPPESEAVQDGEPPGDSRPATLPLPLSAKEAEPEGEKGPPVATLQALVTELQRSLQEKDLLVATLQAECEARGVGPEQQAPADQSFEVSGPAVPLAQAASSAAEPGLDEEPRAALEEKLHALAEERDRLQQKLQEALASRKDALRKAQEKDRHHREQLKQQKRSYGLLKEQFEQQSQEKEALQGQLRALSEVQEDASLPRPAEEAAPEGPASQALQASEWVAPAGSAVPPGASLGTEGSAERLQSDLEQLLEEKRHLEAQVSHLQEALGSQSEVMPQLQEQVGQLLAELETVKAACAQAEASAVGLRLELEESRAEVVRQESLRLQQVEEEERRERAWKEEVEGLNARLASKEESLRGLQIELREREDRIKALQSQLDAQSQERAQRLQAELAEAQQKSAAEAAEGQSRAQLQRKLQAALVSRKDVMKESKLLREELASTKALLESTSLRLAEAEGRASELEEGKAVLLKKTAVLGEERERLIAEVDRALVENQNASSSCESLKLALEEVTREKTQLEEEAGSLRHAQAQALAEWQEQRRELQREYETLLQSYENVSGEAGRIQRVLEGVRQEKHELFLRLKGTEAEKEEVEARLQGAEREMEGMREKMRKFAKSKQQKILELEEENERLRTEAHPVDGGPQGAEEISAGLREELESSRRSCESLSRQLEALTAERDSLNQQIQDWRQRLQSEEEELRSVREEEENLVADKADGCAEVAASEAADVQASPDTASEPPEPATAALPSPEEEAAQARSLHDEINRYVQQVAQLTQQVADLEEKGRAAAEELSRMWGRVEALGEEKEALEGLLVARGQELEALREKVLAVEQASQRSEEQRAGAVRLKEALAAEKDELEERLMNQLAELNGSIGNYQQDVADLQRQNGELRSEVGGLQGALSRLEEEQRQLLREKAEMAAEKKEHVEQLRSTWKGGAGRAQAKELQELLKEKQQEVRQLQKDCIRSQEKVSSLERTVKALEFVQSESQKELEATKKSLAKAGADTQQAQAELRSCRVLLDDTQSEAARVLAESLKLREELQASQAQVAAQLRQKEKDFERRLAEERGAQAQAARRAEERLEAVRREQARAEGAVGELQAALRRKDQEAQQLQGSLNRTLAQLAAITRSMSSLQDDRDRVIDESRQWERKFGEAIEKKEQELHAREQTCSRLEEQARLTAAQVEELQSRIASLEHNKLAQESSTQKELQRRQEEAELLQEEKRKLVLQLEEAQQQLGSSQNQVQKSEAELRSLREQLAELQGSFAESEAARGDAEKTARMQEASLQECRFRQEQLEADLRASKELTERLHEEMSSKDQKIIHLVASREEAVAAAVLELQQQHKEALEELESRIGQAGEERAVLETEKKRALEKADLLMEKLKSTREESQQHKARLDSFLKSMSSLQDDRDRVLGDYRQLEQRHLAAILEKDQLIQEAAAENNSLKEQLRSLHSRMDDLHAENAKLDAELVRYREDLNQLIAIKDCQQKQLLQTQLERIRALEKEKAEAEGQREESERAVVRLQLEQRSAGQEAEALRASLAQLQREMAALLEDGPLPELQARLQSKAQEAQELSGCLSLVQQRVAELEEELAQARQATAQAVREAEARMKEELRGLHHDAGLMRNETETAEERVAELARDLLEMEQSLLAVTEENQDLKAQIHSFRKAMGSLQDSWDQSNEALRALEKQHSEGMAEQALLAESLRKEKARLEGEQQSLAKHRDALIAELATLRDSVEEKGLLARLEELSQQLRAKDTELARLTAELQGASGQVQSFSKALASLQGERDRLLSELDRARKGEEEAKGPSAAQPSPGFAEVPSLKKALSALQSDRDRLVEELKKLQQQYLQAGVDAAEIARLRAELQEHKRETERLKEEGASRQLELQQLREEKAAWELEAASAAEQQWGHLQRADAPAVAEEQRQRQAAREMVRPGQALKGGGAAAQESEAASLQGQLRSSLEQLHRKEARIQQLNSKLSQVFEEKNALSLQLRGSSRNLREAHQHYAEALARCEALEKQLQGLQPPGKDGGTLPTDAAPGAPQERSEHPRESYTPELQELQMRLSEAKQQQSCAKEGLLQLEELLQEERDRRLAAEEALCAAQGQLRRLELSDWAHPLDTAIEMRSSSEQALLVGPSDGAFSKARGGSGLRRALRSLFCSRRRLPLLASVYVLAVHLLLLLCVTGRL